MKKAGRTPPDCCDNCRFWEAYCIPSHGACRLKGSITKYNKHCERFEKDHGVQKGMTG